MKKLLTVFLFGLSLCGSAWALDSTPVNNPLVLQGLKSAYPRLTITAVYETPMANVYEVVSGQNIMYFFPDTGHMIVGTLWDKTGRNYSQERIAEAQGQMLSKIDKSQALKIGNGPNEVIELTDPDCPYCRKAHEFLKTRDDTTRYIIFAPIAQLHPNAESHAAYILSSSNPESALEEVFAGTYDNAELPEFTNNGRIKDHMAIASSVGVRGTPQFWINGTSVSGANIPRLRELLDQGGATAKIDGPDKSQAN